MVASTDQHPGYAVPWSRVLPNTPVEIAAGASVSTVVSLSPRAHGVMLGFGGSANVASYTVTGGGTGSVLASGSSPIPGAYVSIPVAPAIDTSITIAVTASGAGGVLLIAAEFYETTGVEQIEGGVGAQAVDNYVFNSTTGLWVPAYSASADGLTIGNLPLVSLGLFSSSGGRSARASSPSQLGFQFSAALDSLPGVMPYLYNGTSMDSQYNNWFQTLLASAARTTSGVSANTVNPNARGVVFYVNVTVVSGATPTLSFQLQILDPVTVTSAPIGAAGANITATGNYLFVCYPTALAGLNGQVNAPLPRNFNLAWTIGGTTPSFTFSVSASFIL